MSNKTPVETGTQRHCRSNDSDDLKNGAYFHSSTNLDDDKKDYETKQHGMCGRGINNVGVAIYGGGGTCYIASCIQLLYHCVPELRNILLCIGSMYQRRKSLAKRDIMELVTPACMDVESKITNDDDEGSWKRENSCPHERPLVLETFVNESDNETVTTFSEDRHNQKHSLHNDEGNFVKELSKLFVQLSNHTNWKLQDGEERIIKVLRQNTNYENNCHDFLEKDLVSFFLSSSFNIIDQEDIQRDKEINRSPQVVNPIEFYKTICQWDKRTKINLASPHGGDAGDMMNLLLWNICNNNMCSVVHDAAIDNNSTTTKIGTITFKTSTRNDGLDDSCEVKSWNSSSKQDNVSNDDCNGSKSISWDTHIKNALHTLEGRTFQTLYVRRPSSSSDDDSSSSSSTSSSESVEEDHRSNNDDESSSSSPSSCSCCCCTSNSCQVQAKNVSHHFENSSIIKDTYLHWKESTTTRLFRGTFPVSVLGHKCLYQALLHSTILPQHVINYQWKTSTTSSESNTISSNYHDMNHSCYEEVCDKLTFRKSFFLDSIPSAAFEKSVEKKSGEDVYSYYNGPSPHHLMMQLKRFHTVTTCGENNKHQSNNGNSRSKVTQKHLGKLHIPLEMNLNRLFALPRERIFVSSVNLAEDNDSTTQSNEKKTTAFSLRSKKPESKDNTADKEKEEIPLPSSGTERQNTLDEESSLKGNPLKFPLSHYRYTLRGVIIHAGKGPHVRTAEGLANSDETDEEQGGGHYFTMVRNVNVQRNTSDRREERRAEGLHGTTTTSKSIDTASYAMNKDVEDNMKDERRHEEGDESFDRTNSTCWTIFDDECVKESVWLTKSELSMFIDGGPKAKFYDNDPTLPQCAMLVMYTQEV